MARQKQVEPATIKVERIEHIERLADSINEDLMGVEERVDEILDRLEEIHDAFNDNATILQQTVDAVNQHAQGSNELVQRVSAIQDRADSLMAETAALRILHRGAREDIKREREAGAFGREALLARCENLEHKMQLDYELLRSGIRRLEDAVFLPYEPTLWERIKAFVRGES